jgi:hypothetical protein
VADRDKDLTHLFVRDLDAIPLPARDRWRPAPRKESGFMKTSRYVLSATAVAAVLVLALIASFVLRDGSPVAGSPSPSARTAPPATSAPSVATASPGAGSPTAPAAALAGAITGTLSYPSDFVPPLTVYAVSVADQRVFYSVDTPRFGAGGASPPGGPSYTISAVAPGTYYVYAFRNDNLPNDFTGPALYSKFVLTCMHPSRAGEVIPPGACDSNTADHSLVPVTVRAGETVSRIDPWDWTSQGQPNLPPRPR